MQAMDSLQDSWASTSLGWQETNLKIVDKKSRLVALCHNIAQLKIHNTKQLQIKRGFPVRVIVCKARQEGVSTGEAADMFENVNRKPNRHGCLVSADQDSTNKVFKMIRKFQTYMPSDKRKRTIASNRKELEYAEPHNSSILCQTAGKEVLGRGGTIHDFHATEVAFWARAEKQLGGALEEIPEEPDTCITFESTAFGTTGAFHDRFWTAVDRITSKSKDYNGFLPIFLPWQIFPEYQMEIPSDFRLDLYEDHEVYGNEKRLALVHGCAPEQLYWRRYKIENNFNNDLPRFMQEYPSTAKEAFQGTGRMVFIPSAIDKLEMQCRKPIGNIEFFEVEGKVRYRDVARHANCWAVWKWPQANHDYCLFGDVAEGISSDATNPRSMPDRSVAIVLDRMDFDLPMVYYGRPDTIEFADQMVMAAKFWNYAWSSPEMNSIGQSALDAFKRADYQYIYNREHKAETDNEIDSMNLGWKTTTKTRKPMIADLGTAINEGEIRIYDQRVVDELRVFVYGKDGKPQAEVGEFDDCTMTLAGVIQLHKRCPFRVETYDHFNDSPTAKNMNVISAAGAVDDGDDDDDDDEPDIYSEEEIEVLYGE